MDADWLNFFSTLAAIGAGSGALVFVALGNSWKPWTDLRLRRLVGLRTLSEFLMPSFFSAAVLIPPHDWHIPAIVIGLSGFIVVFQYDREARRNPALLSNKFDRAQYSPLMGTGSPYLGLLLMSVIDLTGFNDSVSNLRIVSVVMLLLIAVGWAEVWSFFVTPPTDDPTQSSPKS